MPFILRKIRKARWYQNGEIPWLAAGELQADPLADLATSDNTLSVYLIESDKSNLERVVTALAANCNKVSNLDFALLDLGVFSKLEIKVECAAGQTPDEQVNKWHRDLVELSAQKLIELAKAILSSAGKKRLSKRSLVRLIAEALEFNHISAAKLKPGVLKKIQGELGQT